MAKHLALYRKYRSRKLSDIVGQDHITTTLQHALKSGRISHAYLFTGPRGVGKTSVARIIAHEVNELPYTDESGHIDIVEIDAASNRRIDEIRQLREKIHIAPAAAKYKVYIIDEVHMLTKEAFNALLKTLEEPPAHAIFILATTEAHKLPSTIISRAQRHSFKPIKLDKMVGHLKSIAKKEKINITDKALEMVAEHGDGSFRDAISLLDQISSHGHKIDTAEVRQMLGLAPGKTIDELLANLEAGQQSKIIEIIDEAVLEGINPVQLANQIVRSLRQRARDGSLKEPQLRLIDDLLAVASSLHPVVVLEIALLKNIPVEPGGSDGNKTSTSENTAAKQGERHGDWDQALAAIKRTNNALYAVLRMAEADWQDDKLVLEFKFDFHKKSVQSGKNLDLMKQTLADADGNAPDIEMKVNPKANPKGAASPDKPPPQNVIDAFGGGEVVEL